MARSSIGSVPDIFLIFISLVFISFISDDSVTTDGSLSFTVKTVTYNGDRSLKNIVAIWVEDVQGNFIKTRLLQADKRKEWLLTWNNKSKGSTVDAITAATLNSHQTHTIVWDCTNESGALVEDGEYKVLVEFTEAHAQGPMTSVTFTKGSVSQTVTPNNEANFTDMKLEYSVGATGIFDISSFSDELKIYPNPFNGTEQMNLDNYFHLELTSFRFIPITKYIPGRL